MDENKEIAENEELEAEAEEESVSSDESAKEKEAEKKKDKFTRDLVDIVESTIITVFAIMLIFTYILHPVNIVGRSMVPTLNKSVNNNTDPTDKVFMTTIYFGIDYGDILVINKDKNYLLDENGDPYVPEGRPSLNECIIKRVIAVGGQTVDIRDGKVIVDGKVLDEPYIAPNSTTEGLGGFDAQYPITIPEGYYFVMGDNRNHSTDSRAASVGLIKKDQIYGKAIIKYAPLSEFEILTDSYKG
ncbi:MAG: signal peptidase I [Alistipes sp.]|nr:signal peptidase I [Alistipes sp.]